MRESRRGQTKERLFATRQFEAASSSSNENEHIGPTNEASEYKLYATQVSQRAANAALDIMGAEGQLRVDTEEAPLEGRFEGTYRCTVVETIGGGASEIQKNIIARRKLGLPKNF